MRDYEWFVSFDDTGPEHVVRAGDEDEAKVLAQAARIKAGLQWRRIREVRLARPARERRLRVNPLV
jgi:hypothetical protein